MHVQGGVGLGVEVGFGWYSKRQTYDKTMHENLEDYW